MNKNTLSIFYVILAAALYAINAPISKLLLAHIPTTMMAGFLYLGAGAGLSLLIFREIPSGIFLLALTIMAIGTYLASTD